MSLLNKGVFTERTYKPTYEEVTKTLGIVKSLWDQLVNFVEESYKIKGEFKFYGKNYGWALRYCKSGKALASLYPGKDEFTVQVILDAKQVDEAITLDTDKGIKEIIQNTPEIHEGRWIFIRIIPDTNISDIQKVILVRAQTKGKK